MKVVYALIMLLIFGVIGLFYWKEVEKPAIDSTQESEAQLQQTEDSDQPDQLTQDTIFQNQEVQAVIDNWAGGLTGTASVFISDLDGNRIAVHNQDQVYFAASLYKLFVAYFGYIQVDSGDVDASEPYVGARTRSSCLDAMIRDSDSPCAEKMWVELGKQRLTDALYELGIRDTSMINITTTASDTARILALFGRGGTVSEESQAAFFASAKDQVFRNALNAGFSDNVIVYNKVGFNELKEYHDAAIVELPDGRRFIIAVLTENVGTRNIAELARRVEATILTVGEQ